MAHGGEGAGDEAEHHTHSDDPYRPFTPTRELQEVLRLQEETPSIQHPAFDASVRVAVADVVQRQIAIGLNVINDGEQGRSQYAAYVKERLTVFDGERPIRARPRLGDAHFPEYVATHQSSTAIPQPACNGPIAWREKQAIQQDIATLKAAVGTRQVEEASTTAASPGVIANFLPNDSSSHRGGLISLALVRS